MEQWSKLEQLVRSSGRWERTFDTFGTSEWENTEPQVVEWFAALDSKRAGALGTWPMRVFGTPDAIRELRNIGFDSLQTTIDTIIEEFENSGKKTSLTLNSLLELMNEHNRLPPTLYGETDRYAMFLKLGRHLQKDDCLKSFLAFHDHIERIVLGGEPGTPLFLEDLVDLVLSNNPSPSAHPRDQMVLKINNIGVPACHPQLDSRAVMVAINFAYFQQLKKSGNAACLKWTNRMNKLGSYRKRLFTHLGLGDRLQLFLQELKDEPSAVDRLFLDVPFEPAVYHFRGDGETLVDSSKAATSATPTAAGDDADNLIMQEAEELLAFELEKVEKKRAEEEARKFRKVENKKRVKEQRFLKRQQEAAILQEEAAKRAAEEEAAKQQILLQQRAAKAAEEARANEARALRKEKQQRRRTRRVTEQQKERDEAVKKKTQRAPKPKPQLAQKAAAVVASPTSYATSISEAVMTPTTSEDAHSTFEQTEGDREYSSRLNAFVTEQSIARGQPYDPNSYYNTSSCGRGRSWSVSVLDDLVEREVQGLLRERLLRARLLKKGMAAEEED